MKKLGKRAAHQAVSVSNLWGSSVAGAVAGMARETGRGVVVVCGHLDEADDLADDLELFSGRRPEILPALELAGSLGKVSEEQVSNRLRLIARLSVRRRSAAEPAVLMVRRFRRLMQSVPSRVQLGELILRIVAGQDLEAEKLIVWLAEHGYNRLDQVEVPGDFAVRGGIVDVYLPGMFEHAGEQMGLTVRMDFFDDQIESIRRFDLDTLGSREKLESVAVMDIKGKLPDDGRIDECVRVICRPTRSWRCGRRWRSPSRRRVIWIGCRM